MKTLREYIKEAGEWEIAIGHFNISNLEALHGIYGAAKNKMSLTRTVADSTTPMETSAPLTR